MIEHIYFSMMLDVRNQFRAPWTYRSLDFLPFYAICSHFTAMASLLSANLIKKNYNQTLPAVVNAEQIKLSSF